MPADPDVGKWEGGGLTATRSARKADGKGVTMFRIVWSNYCDFFFFSFFFFKSDAFV